MKVCDTVTILNAYLCVKRVQYTVIWMLNLHPLNFCHYRPYKHMCVPILQSSIVMFKWPVSGAGCLVRMVTSPQAVLKLL